jgi:pimeloyl-ACP methyl ester carboxylesterase
VVAFLAAAFVVLALVERAWVRAGADGFVVLTTTARVPVLGWFARVVTAEPRVEETRVAGIPATVARPPGEGPWPALVFVNGVTARGRRHPEVQRLARGFARAGYFVVVPELPGLRSGTLTFRTYEAAVDVALATEYRMRGPVTLAGVSVGASLAILAAEDLRLATRVRAVLGVAPYASVAHVARLATTSTYEVGTRIVPYRPDPFVGLVIGRSLSAALPPGADRARLIDVFRARHKGDREPLRDLPPMRSRAGAALRRLLANRDPRRFDELWARLPVSVRRVPFLSPLVHVRRLRAPVYLATAPHDKYFPPAESRELTVRSPEVTLTVTRTLAHAVPHLSGGDVADLFRFVGFFVRGLHAAR